MRAQIVCGGLLIISMLGWTASGCDETTCGEGTIEKEGECVPLQPVNCSGPGVRFENGRCVPDFSEVCGPGTELSEDETSCVPTEPIADPAPDAGQDPTPEVSDVLEDIEEEEVLEDIEEEEITEWVPECGDDLVAGEEVCLWGQALNFINLAPLPGDTADPELQIQVKDLFLAVSEPTSSLAEAPIEADGWFIVPSFDLQETPPRDVIIIVGEDEEADLESPGTVWQRCISGLIRTDDTTEEYGDLTVFGLPRASVESWATELGTLDPTGFVLIRIVEVLGEGVYAPLAGATLDYLGAGTVDIHYFSDAALTSFKSGSDPTTGPSGVALLVPGEGAEATDGCSASATGYDSAGAAACGANPGRASINYIFMVTAD